MDQKEINMVKTKLAEAGIERSAQGVGGELVVPDLSGDEEIRAAYAGGRESRADGGFVIVHGCRIDMAEPEGKPAFDQRTGGIAPASEMYRAPDER